MTHLLEILEDRHNSSSTIMARQLPIKKWHDTIGEPSLSDAICDRIVHNAHKITLTWARRVGREVPEETDLANYLGRSLAGFILSVSIFMYLIYLAARDPWEYRVIFDLLILALVFAAAIHFYRFLKKIQTLIEHVEILIYSGLAPLYNNSVAFKNTL